MSDETITQPEVKKLDSEKDNSPDVIEVEKVDEEVDSDEPAFGKRPVANPPEDSPLDQNGYAGVDPDYQREPLDQ